MPNETDQSGTQSLKDAIDGAAITGFSDELHRGYLDTLSELDRSQTVVDFFAFLIRYIEYNRVKYLTCEHEIIQLKQEFASLKREVQSAINTSINTLHAPQVRFTITPNAAASTAPGARAAPPNLDPMESILINSDGTYSRKMGHVGNNVTKKNFLFREISSPQIFRASHFARILDLLCPKINSDLGGLKPHLPEKFAKIFFFIT